MSSVPSPFQIEREMSAAMRLQAALMAEDGTLSPDDQLMIDTLDGETDVFAKLDALIESSMADAILAELAAARAKRFKQRVEVKRDEARRMLEALRLNRPLERAAYTASIAYRQKVEANEAELPEAFIRRAPDLVALARALKAGPVPGATLSEPQPHLVVRTR